jgi:putative DNA primase/helicase
MDIVGQWIEERCEVDASAKTTSAELYGDFELWAQTEIGFTMTAVAFGRDLAERGHEKIKIDRARGFRGLKLRRRFP